MPVMSKRPGYPLMFLNTLLAFILVSGTHFVSPDVLRNGEQVSPSPRTLSQNAQADSYPYVTIKHVSPSSVEVSWNCSRDQSLYDKYEVTLKPLEASYRVVENVPFNTCWLKLDRLDPDTSYQVSVVSISGRVRKKSSSVIFRTLTHMELDLDYGEIVEDEAEASTATATSSSVPFGDKDRLRLPRIRLVEVALVAMALILWAGAIVLFFHRWGKIRMLLPYQPDYREMKRNSSVCANCSMTPHHQCCRVHQLAYAGAEFVGPLMGATALLAIPTNSELVSIPVTDTGCSPIRPRLNSFVLYNDVNERRKEYAKNACRKSKSAENLEHYSSFPAERQNEVEGPEGMNCTTEL